MAFKVFASGEVLTAADVNDYLMEQAVIVCTSGTRPSSPHHGMVIYETDTKQYRSYNTTAAGWVVLMQTEYTSHTPTLSTSGAPLTIGTSPTRQSRYIRYGGTWVHYHGVISLGTSFATGSGNYLIDLPIAAVSLFSAGVDNIGTGIIRDDSAGAVRQMTPYIAGATSTMAMFAGDAQVTATAPWTWAVSDYLAWDIHYECAATA